jgi:hypothetical protein
MPLPSENVTITHKVLYLVTTQHQYVVNNTRFWLHVSVSSNHPQATICYMKYIQCVHTLWDPILFTLIQAKIIPVFNHFNSKLMSF